MPKEKNATPFDFAALEEHLMTGCRAVITQFAKEATASDPVTFFAIDSNPYYGEFLPSFDTVSTSLAWVRNNEADVLSGREWMKLRGKNAWLRTYEGAYRSSVPMFNVEVSEFTHHMFGNCKYSPLDALARSAPYKALNAPAKKDGWIEGHTRVTLARVCDRLVGESAFAKLPRSKPFGVGYQYHDEKMVVCRVIVD